MSDLAIFEFESQEIRFVGTPEKLEWVASDVINILYPEADKRNRGNYLKKVPDKWKGRKRIMTLGGEQEVITLFESGFFWLLGRSNSLIAIPFQEWLYEDVIPGIRKTGSYAMPTAVKGATIATPVTPQPQLLPTPVEISEVVDLILGQTGLDPKLVAGAKGNAIARLHPQHAATIEAAKTLLSTPVDSNLVRPTVLAEKLTETTGEKWSAVRVNKVLIEQDFQIKNPDGKNPTYLPTEKGLDYGQLVLDTARGRDKTIQSLQWHLSVLEALEANDH